MTSAALASSLTALTLVITLELLSPNLGLMLDIFRHAAPIWAALTLKPTSA